MIHTNGKKENYKLVEKTIHDFYTIRWNYAPYYDESGSELPYGDWSEHTFINKPSIEQVKNFILEQINADTDYKILTRFQWTVPSTKDTNNPIVINCYLSQENQFNYKSAYDLAFQTQGASLPFILKFGSTDKPEYYTFTSLTEFGDFYYSAINFINTTLKEGWVKKDSIDWAEYERLLEEIN